MLRGSGVPYDLRKAQPYSSYDHFDFDVPIGRTGDVYDRYLVRMQEMRESLKIISQAFENLPDGPVNTTDRRVALPPRNELNTSMESLIHHFKLVTEGMRVPAGQVYQAVESPRGELGFYLVSDGTNRPVSLQGARAILQQPERAAAHGPRRADRRRGRGHRLDRHHPRGRRPMTSRHRKTFAGLPA